MYSPNNAPDREDPDGTPPPLSSHNFVASFLFLAVGFGGLGIAAIIALLSR